MVCLPVCDTLAAVRHSRLISSGTCCKTMYAVRTNCIWPRNTKIKSEKCKIRLFVLRHFAITARFVISYAFCNNFCGIV